MKYLVKTPNAPLIEIEVIQKSPSETYWKIINHSSKDHTPFWINHNDYSIIECLTPTPKLDYIQNEKIETLKNIKFNNDTTHFQPKFSSMLDDVSFGNNYPYTIS